MDFACGDLYEGGHESLVRSIGAMFACLTCVLLICVTCVEVLNTLLVVGKSGIRFG